MLNRICQGLGIAAVAVALLFTPTIVSAKSRLTHGTSKSRMTHGHARSRMVHSHPHQSNSSSKATKKTTDKDKK
jgi:hypothetical protein